MKARQQQNEPATVEKTPAELVDDALSEISKHTFALYRWIPLIRDMADTHREGLGFVPEATRKVVGQQYAREQLELRQAVLAGLPAGKGESRVPGNLTSWGLEAEIAMTLRHELRIVIRQLHAETCPARRRPPTHGVIRAIDRPVCTCGLQQQLPARQEDETTEQLISRFRTVMWTVTDLVLASAVLVDVAHLAETARRALFGEDRTQLGAECPHCGRRSLVVYLQTGVIACERAREDDGSTPPCKCGDRLCPCQIDNRFEHQWLRDRPKGHPRSWQTFAGVLKQHTNRKGDTR